MTCSNQKSYEGNFTLEFLTEEQFDKVANVSESHPVLSEILKVDRKDLVIYISGSVDSKEEVVEKFLLMIAKAAPTDFEATITREGSSPGDKTDLILKESWLYFREYQLLPGEIVRYNPQS